MYSIYNQKTLKTPVEQLLDKVLGKQMQVAKFDKQFVAVPIPTKNLT